MKFSGITAGDVLIVGSGFDCMREGLCLKVKDDGGGDLYVTCQAGRHYLIGQRDVHDNCVGFELVEKAHDR